jgi:hypothetical protein
MIFLDLFEKLPHRSIFDAKGTGCHRRSGSTASCDGRRIDLKRVLVVHPAAPLMAKHV